jgi:hypothetical protein
MQPYLGFGILRTTSPRSFWCLFEPRLESCGYDAMPEWPCLMLTGYRKGTKKISDYFSKAIYDRISSTLPLNFLGLHGLEIHMRTAVQTTSWYYVLVSRALAQ